jgi:hypothetical protein
MSHLVEWRTAAAAAVYVFLSALPLFERRFGWRTADKSAVSGSMGVVKRDSERIGFKTKNKNNFEPQRRKG